MPTERQTEQPIEQMKQLQEQNIAIAAFDGWEFLKGDATLVCPSCEGERLSSITYCICHEKADKLVKDNYTIIPVNLKYHSSWEELMSAWRKLYELFLQSENTSVKICFLKQFIDPMSRAMITGNLTTAHKILYDAIQWLNQQSK